MGLKKEGKGVKWGQHDYLPRASMTLGEDAHSAWAPPELLAARVGAGLTERTGAMSLAHSG